MISDITLKLNSGTVLIQDHGINEGGAVQKYIDSEVLRYTDPYIPKDTGTLIRSGTSGTVLGTGDVIYNAPYAANQYYNTADTRSYDPMRGAHFFERMKADHKDDILRGVDKMLGR